MKDRILCILPDKCSRQCQIQAWTHGIHGLFLTCRKINTCYYTNNSNAHIYMGKGFQEAICCLVTGCCITCEYRDVNSLVTLRKGGIGFRILFYTHPLLCNVNTWAISFLRHLANIFSMVPFWASTDSDFVPIWGPRPKLCRPEEIIYSPNDSCSHFTQRLFPPKLPRNIHELFLTIHSTSFISIVHHIHASNYILIYITYSLFHFFGSS